MRNNFQSAPVIDASTDSQIAKSALYSGWIRHRRFHPVSNEFEYKIFMLYLNLDELEQIQIDVAGFHLERKWSASGWCRKDYYQPETPSLKSAIQARILAETGDHFQGEIMMLAHTRFLGVGFNPVTFYYCYDRHQNLNYILAEITNTPWKEKHSYLLVCRDHHQLIQIAPHPEEKMSQNKNKLLRFHFEKGFHVSPFNPMAMCYQWTFSKPSDRLSVHMENIALLGHMGGRQLATPLSFLSQSRSKEANDQYQHLNNRQIGKHFDATLVMDRQPLTTKTLAKAHLTHPWMSARVVMGIYWQATKLWSKRAPFYDHPEVEKNPGAIYPVSSNNSVCAKKLIKRSYSDQKVWIE